MSSNHGLKHADTLNETWSRHIETKIKSYPGQQILEILK